MKKTGNEKRGQTFWLAALTLLLTAALWLFPDWSGMVSHADSQGRVTATSANIRKEPSSTSEAIGSTVKDKIITIKSQVKGSDGHTWYQTFVNSETLGYIRSDLVTIIDGTTPATGTVVPATTTTPTPTPTPVEETPAEVSAVNPVSAKVTGGNSIRVRSNASTSSSIVKKVSSGLALTVTGTAKGKDGKTWYQVSFTDGGTEVEGFIRSDYVKLSGELTPYEEPAEPTPPPAEEPGDPGEPDEPAPPEVIKDFDTSLEDGVWYLLDRQKNYKHDIAKTLEAVDNNALAYQKAEKQVKTQKGIIIVLILFLVAAVAACTLLFFKMKDMADAAYFNEVESETMRRRGTASSRSGSQRVMHTVGSGSQTGRPAGQRPTGTRPPGASQGSSQRPTGTRPSGTSQGSGQRPAGTRPSGTSQGSGQRPAGTRPSGATQGSGQRPAGARPAGTSQGTQGQRPSGAPQGTQGQRPSGAPQGAQGQRPSGTSQGAQGQKNAGNQQGWQSKNFMTDDDDEFDFEFLNYDGDEEV